MWQNGQNDPDAVWDGEWRVSRGIDVLDGGDDWLTPHLRDFQPEGEREMIGEGEGVILGVNFGHPIVTSGDYVAKLCESA